MSRLPWSYFNCLQCHGKVIVIRRSDCKQLNSVSILFLVLFFVHALKAELKIREKVTWYTTDFVVCKSKMRSSLRLFA